MGVRAGEPDLELRFKGGRVVYIELKVPGGEVSLAQRRRHAVLRALGFAVHVHVVHDLHASLRWLAELVRAHGVAAPLV